MGVFSVSLGLFLVIIVTLFQCMEREIEQNARTLEGTGLGVRDEVRD